MSINIKNREAEQLVAELKARTGKGTTDLLLDLLRREKERLAEDEEGRIAKALANARRLQQSWAARPLVDPRPSEEIVAYDDDGLPT